MAGNHEPTQGGSPSDNAGRRNGRRKYFPGTDDRRQFPYRLLIAKDFERAKEVGRFLTHSIDAYHRKFRDAVTLERTDLDLLVDFNRIEEGS